MHRGCASDISDDKITCNTLDRRCGLCQANHLQGCNGEPAWRGPYLACSHCEKSESCAWGQITSIKSCSKIVHFPDKESCYTSVDKANGDVTRGCTLDDSIFCTENGNACKKCSTGYGCNNRNVKTQSCLICRSFVSGEEQCADKFPLSFDTECYRKPVHQYNERGCYIKKYGKIVERGCTMDLAFNDKQQCINGETECSFCDGHNCNFGPAPGSAWAIKALSSIAVLALVAFLKVI